MTFPAALVFLSPTPIRHRPCALGQISLEAQALGLASTLAHHRQTI